MISCESHCTECDRHFASDEAFDLHRQFMEGHDNDWDHRVCVDRQDDRRLEVADADGVCELSNAGPTPVLHVEVLRIAAGVTVA